MLFNLDLQVQLLLKQGQVEVDEGDFIPDYSGSVLVHRRVIEELNKEIKVLISSPLSHDKTQISLSLAGLHRLLHALH